jgi:hypothetical protein
LVAKQIARDSSIPDYAQNFLPERFDDKTYVDGIPAMMSGQL